MKEDLIKGCRKNSRKAQEALYREYAPKVIGICRRYATERDDADDIFQEAFINIYSSLKKSKEEIQSLEAWIRRISVNTAINYYHKNKKYADNLSIDYAKGQDYNQEYEKILSKLSMQELLELISDLPLGCKLVFNLYTIEGYSHKEIAEKLNISEGTSKSQLSRAKNIMKTKINHSNKVRYESIA
ncbi:RNA polymerase sigma factor [Fulvivirga sediminis]|uniref:Sigma-70 family RNA polymerase sigma factor n=1 Tax=Fulvivirga sediminis TaxID=2803949 RepID=A0A937F930_9BACT|nr:sigma-70 family RNA polymerase sigma factor [Fulvivirga sediminis]MBL3658727.1 sigma-70 family RNA polymerase sigma factor [Fulvivirga sediminis]